MPESVQSCFELTIHFPVFFTRELFLVAVHGWFVKQTNVWKVQTMTGRFLAQQHPFPSAKGFQFMNFLDAMFYENYLTLDFHTNTVISRRVCLLVKMASETVMRLIHSSPTQNFLEKKTLSRS